MCGGDSGYENGVRRNCGKGGRWVGKIFGNVDLDVKDRVVGGVDVCEKIGVAVV